MDHMNTITVVILEVHMSVFIPVTLDKVSGHFDAELLAFMPDTAVRPDLDLTWIDLSFFHQFIFLMRLNRLEVGGKIRIQFSSGCTIVSPCASVWLLHAVYRNKLAVCFKLLDPEKHIHIVISAAFQIQMKFEIPCQLGIFLESILKDCRIIGLRIISQFAFFRYFLLAKCVICRIQIKFFVFRPCDRPLVLFLIRDQIKAVRIHQVMTHSRCEFPAVVDIL